MTRSNGLPCKKCGTADWYDSGNCKECTRKWNAERLRRDPEGNRERNRRWRRRHPEKNSEKLRQWYQDNPAKIQERNRRWRQENPDKNREKVLRWQRANPDKLAAKNNRRRTRKTQAGGDYTAAEWKDLCKQYDYTCLRCGKKEPDIKLTADHVLPVSKGGTSDISNIQPLCKSCNSWKNDKHIDFRTKPGILRWIQQTLFG